MRLLVTGGRNLKDRFLVFDVLDHIHRETPITTVIHGACSGADELASLWAASRHIESIRCPADWDRYGRSAGPIRNKEMLGHAPDLVVAFPGGKGTENMTKQATAAGVKVLTSDFIREELERKDGK